MKKAILLVSHGTTYGDTRKKTIGAIEEKVRRQFPEYDVRRAFTGKAVIRKLKLRDGIYIDTPEEALERLRDEKYTQIIVQPLYIIPGLEYEALKAIVKGYKDKGVFEKIASGRPALSDDYGRFIKALEGHLNKKETFVLVGHGTSHPANACYCGLQKALEEKGYTNVYIGTIEAYPGIELIKTRLLRDKVTKLTLKPLMLVSGYHARKDMVEAEDSWKNHLVKEGIHVEVDMRSLGQIPAFQEIYLTHLRDVQNLEKQSGIS